MGFALPDHAQMRPAWGLASRLSTEGSEIPSRALPCRAVLR